ncbi:Type 2 DNA topoisomerase VI subunit A [Desulfurococcus amylolyticus 1221n]|uniref:Type 2 DNA topoisomerase 6 subunit A n=1 Tax=Desulfurococcus amylolyticus (strain DSM 18924 / JCM 16383 / VKM B-2413 / 1221n) TaxID=490899 RepID=B8D613_DESA1|nr:DNA topoisomerase IV subunit A [Desulfurococcus amylolyticus]ACL11544.1 Type 2 DNA topoisomerase VI subunit A [Desulfurococcus amylolyticus 1221n]
MVSAIDLEARKKAAELMRKIFMNIVSEIEREGRPVLVLPKRTLSNTIYDYKNKLLLLGPETSKRSFMDVNEARKFMQTVLVASIIYDSLVNNEYPTIRDLYYRGKHSISYRSGGKEVHENTWDEQKESDGVIRDLEVYLNILREELLILSKEKGKVVGNLVIRSGDDVIDLSRMGHGAYSIEPTPDLIEFKDVDAEYILVVEKDAVFQQLHRYGFWKKHKAILITSAGQPDRATRRFLRRLSDEYNLPVYILADSDPYGFYIYSVFKIGSITLSYESERLATPRAKFIGVMMTDVFGDDIFREMLREKDSRSRLNSIVKGLDKLAKKKPYLSEAERRNYIIKAKQRDLERAVELVGYDIADTCLDNTELKSKLKKKEGLTGYPWFQTPEWIRELCIFFKTLSKLEIEAMASKGLKFLADHYIPEKISGGDWID